MGDGVLAPAAAGRQQDGAPPLPADPQQQQQYLRLPVESAKKLRWFDRHDVNMLMQLHLREKQELFEANSALRTVLRRRGLSSDAQVEGELRAINAQVDAMRAHEEGVNQVLVLAAQVRRGRAGRVCAVVGAARLSNRHMPARASPLPMHHPGQAEIEHLKEALESAQHEIDHMRWQRMQAAASNAALPQLAAAQAVAAAGGEERVALRLRCVEGGDLEPELVAAELDVVPPPAAAAVEAAGGGVQEAPALPAALAALAAAGSSGGGLDPQLLQAAAAALGHLARVQGVALSGFGQGPAEGSAGGASAPASRAATPDSASAGLQEQCNQLQLQVARLQAELEQEQQDAAFARDAAEHKQAEMRSRFAEAQQRQGEVLRVAQDGRLDAGGHGGGSEGVGRLGGTLPGCAVPLPQLLCRPAPPQSRGAR